MKKLAFAACAVFCLANFAFGADGEAVFKKCIACHGVKAQISYLGKVPVLTQVDPAERLELMKKYKAGEVEGGKGKFNMGAVMKGQMATLSDDDMVAVNDYITTLK